MILNPLLYDILMDRFGNVSIANPGDEMAAHYSQDPFSGALTSQIYSFGEGYNINCPFCNDTRRRLSINHQYGIFDPVTESKNTNLAICFNEDCLKQPGRYKDLEQKIFGFLNRNQRAACATQRIKVAPVDTAAPLEEMSPPGETVPLTDLPDDHPAIRYLVHRGYDPAGLWNSFSVEYCTHADPGHSMAQDRIIAPVSMNGQVVGWIGRLPGDSAFATQPKYLFPSGFQKSRTLYNHDVALNQPMVVVCEGTTDVWRVGPAAVGLFGKTASPTQLDLLLRGWADKPIIVLLDGDAYLSARDLAVRLESRHQGPVVQVVLADDQDPGSLTQEDLWNAITAAATDAGVDLSALVPGNTEVWQ